MRVTVGGLVRHVINTTREGALELMTLVLKPLTHHAKVLLAGLGGTIGLHNVVLRSRVDVVGPCVSREVVLLVFQNGRQVRVLVNGWICLLW